jgi:hypothetical protein
VDRPSAAIGHDDLPDTDSARQPAPPAGTAHRLATAELTGRLVELRRLGGEHDLQLLAH